MYAYNPDIKRREYNPEKAKQLLAEAGYPKGFDTTILLFGAISREPGFIAIQQQLKNVGINAKLEKWDRGQWYKGKYEGWPKNTLFYGLTTRYANLANTLATNFIGTGNYPSGYQPPEWGSMLTEAKATMDFEKHKEILQKMMALSVDSAMCIPLWTIGDMNAFTTNLRDHNLGAAGGDPQQWTPGDVYFAK